MTEVQFFSQCPLHRPNMNIAQSDIRKKQSKILKKYAHLKGEIIEEMGGSSKINAQGEHDDVEEGQEKIIRLSGVGSLTSKNGHDFPDIFVFESVIRKPATINKSGEKSLMEELETKVEDVNLKAEPESNVTLSDNDAVQSNRVTTPKKLKKGMSIDETKIRRQKLQKGLSLDESRVHINGRLSQISRTHSTASTRHSNDNLLDVAPKDKEKEDVVPEEDATAPERSESTGCDKANDVTINIPMMSAVLVGGALGGPVGLLTGIQLGAACAMGGGILGYCTGQMVEEQLERQALRDETKRMREHSSPRPVRRSSMRPPETPRLARGTKPKRQESLDSYLDGKRQRGREGEGRGHHHHLAEEKKKEGDKLALPKGEAGKVIPRLQRSEVDRPKSIEVCFNYRTKLH